MIKGYKIDGNKQLKGTIKVQGCKNSALAIIAASLLCKDKVTLYNVPRISDVFALLNILKKINVTYSFKKNTLKIDSKNIEYKPLLMEEIKDFRASYYFLGVFLSLFSKVEILIPGGCKIGNRPLDLHIKGLKKIGASIVIKEDKIIGVIDKYRSNIIYLDIASVGATINILLAGAFHNTYIIINNAAKEPEITDLVTFLNKMGCKIKGKESSKLEVLPTKTIKKVKYKIMSDRIVAGTFLLYGMLLAKKLTIKNFIYKDNEALISVLKRLNVKMKSKKKKVIIYKSILSKSIDITTGVFPNFPTDLQQVMCASLLFNKKSSTIKETLFENRFTFLKQIKKMNGKYLIKDNKVTIYPSKIKNNNIICEDLRGGAALLLCCLVAKGTSILNDVKYIERGYEDIVVILRKLGASIDEIYIGE